MLKLVVVNLFRNPLRTFLTMASVAVALFLFCALGGILDTLQEAIKVGSESRLVTRNKISLVQWLPMAYQQRIAAVPGVKRVAVQQWFGGQDPADTKGFFAQFAVDDTWYGIYGKDFELAEASPAESPGAIPDGADPRLAAYFQEQTACVVGQKLMLKKGWKLGQTITLAGTIFPGSWPFTIRAVYRSKVKAFNSQVFFFHYKYLYEKSEHQSQAGIYKVLLRDPSQAAEFARKVDAQYENSANPTHTETERAFAAGFISMYGNLPFVIRVIGLAVVFAILLIAANTMVMAVRERTSEVGVLKTLGFTDAMIFGMVLAEAAAITFTGGLIGALGAKKMVTGFSLGGLLPPMTVRWNTVWTGVVIAVLIGAVSGFIPAWQASRLRIVNALRRVD